MIFKDPSVRLRPFLCTLLAACLVGCGEKQAANPQAITRAQAIALAERYVRENGYTDQPAVRERLDPESLDWNLPREQALQMRANTLKGKAIGAQAGGRNSEPGWGVAFDYAGSMSDPSICRVVTMDPYGKGLVMQHQDGRRSYWVDAPTPPYKPLRALEPKASAAASQPS